MTASRRAPQPASPAIDRRSDAPAGDLPAWDECLGRARASLDEHKIKLVDVAHEQAAFYSDPLYRRAAARRLRMIQSG